MLFNQALRLNISWNIVTKSAEAKPNHNAGSLRKWLTQGDTCKNKIENWKTISTL